MYLVSNSNRERQCGFSTEKGFTLLEVLITVAVIAMIIVTAPVLYGRVFPSFEVRQYANQIVYTLRSLRSEARQNHEIKVLIIDNDVLKVIDPQIEYPVPHDTEVRIVPEPLWNTKGIDAISFFPSGSSSGGQIEVRRDETSIRINIDWFSGRAHIIEA